MKGKNIFFQSELLLTDLILVKWNRKKINKRVKKRKKIKKKRKKKNNKKKI